MLAEGAEGAEPWSLTRWTLELPLNHPLANGDQVEILAGKHANQPGAPPRRGFWTGSNVSAESVGDARSHRLRRTCPRAASVHPSTLQYAVIGGERVLVGVAYTVYRHPDDPLPGGFPGVEHLWQGSTGPHFGETAPGGYFIVRPSRRKSSGRRETAPGHELKPPPPTSERANHGGTQQRDD